MSLQHVTLDQLIKPAKLRRSGNSIFPILSMTMHEGLVEQKSKFKKRVASTDTSQYKVVKRNQLVVGFPIDEGVLSFQHLFDEAIVSPAYDVWDLRNDEQVDSRYLERFLRSSRALNFYKSKLRGTTARRRTLPDDIFLSLIIPLPTLPEQKRIVNILDRAEALRAKRRAALAQLDELVQSIFIEMFGDLETNHKGWIIKSFDHFAKIDTKMIKDFSEYENKPHIGIENIERDTGNLINYEEVGAQNLTSGKYLFTKDHIIYSKIRPNLNKVALPDFDGLCSADAYPLLVNKNYTNRYFFAYILRSKYFLNNILKLSDRTNIPKVNKDQLRSFECICPPIELQNQFAHRVEAVKKIKEMHKTSLAKLDELFSSLQYRAFRGEL